MYGSGQEEQLCLLQSKFTSLFLSGNQNWISGSSILGTDERLVTKTVCVVRRICVKSPWTVARCAAVENNAISLPEQLSFLCSVSRLHRGLLTQSIWWTAATRSRRSQQTEWVFLDLERTMHVCWHKHARENRNSCAWVLPGALKPSSPGSSPTRLLNFSDMSCMSLFCDVCRISVDSREPQVETESCGNTEKRRSKHQM